MLSRLSFSERFVFATLLVEFVLLALGVVE